MTSKLVFRIYHDINAQNKSKESMSDYLVEAQQGTFFETSEPLMTLLTISHLLTLSCSHTLLNWGTKMEPQLS